MIELLFDRGPDDVTQDVRRDRLALDSLAIEGSSVGRFRWRGRQVELGNLRRSYG